MAVRAVLVSQLTCLALLGIDERRYLDLLVPLCKGSVVALGNLRLLGLDVAEAALHGLARGTANETTEPVVELDEQPESADAVLAAIGRRRIAGGR